MRDTIIIPRNDLRIKRSYLVEVPINDIGVGAKPNFERDNVLNPDGTGSVIFTSLEVYTFDLMTKAPSGRPVITQAEAQKLVCTFMWKSDEFIKSYPLTGLISNINYGMIRNLDKVKIDLTKSYLSVLDAGIGAGKSAIFNFTFIDQVKDIVKPQAGNVRKR